MEYRVKSWLDFQEKIFDNTYKNNIKRYRSDYIFRGLSNVDYELKTSLSRCCDDNGVLERALHRNFHKYSINELPNDCNFWDLITIAQHHGLPTRLLDWTFSPYVALHFATEDFSRYDSDGAIWCIDFIEATKLLPNSFKDYLNKFDAIYFTTGLLNGIAKDYDDMCKFEINNSPFMIFFEPPSIDSRIVNQYALFSFLSSTTISIQNWFNDNSSIVKKIIIPKELKLEFRDKLDQINITERVIYPGLDGLCSWLKRHYTPTDNIKR